MSIEERTEKTWNKAYPDRKLWKDIGQGAQQEWIRVFEIYESIRDSERTDLNYYSDEIHGAGLAI